MLCENGCGNEGKFQLNGRKPKGKFWCCSKSSNSCPAIKEKKKNSMLKKYGVENPAQLPDSKKKAQQTMLERYGDKNYNTIDMNRPENKRKAYHKMMETLNTKFGVSNASFLKSTSESRKKTMQERYGVDGIWLMNHATSSKEAREYIKSYIASKGYALDQVAYDDPEYNLFEWGHYYKGSWCRFDLVVFEEGYRGNKDKIIEILEYHGPFHYTENDAKERPNEPAIPWGNSITILESYKKDMIKKEFANMVTEKFIVVWSDHYQSGP